MQVSFEELKRVFVVLNLTSTGAVSVGPLKQQVTAN